jgi:hypothetical protein
MHRTTMLVICTLVLALCVGSAFAATGSTTSYPDTLKVNYFSYANTTGDPDGTVRILNTGLSGGNLCADIYVYDAAQEISECGSCLITPNGLLTLSVNTNLTANPLTGSAHILSTGSILIVSAAPNSSGTCPLPAIGVVVPTAGLRAWGTHIQLGSYETETDFQDETLSSAELKTLEKGCYAIKLDGSGAGQISCTTETD